MPEVSVYEGEVASFEDLRASWTSTCPSSSHKLVLLNGYLNSKQAQQKQVALLRLTVSPLADDSSPRFVSWN